MLSVFVSNVQGAAPRGGVFSRYQKYRGALKKESGFDQFRSAAGRWGGKYPVSVAEIQELTQAERAKSSSLVSRRLVWLCS